jgi:hypothetical protein
MNDKPAILLSPHVAKLGLLLLLLASLVAYVLSQGGRYGDSIVYAGQIDRGVVIEPGHLLWRPLLYAIGRGLGTLGSYSATVWTLQGVCLAASVAGVAAVYALCRNVAGAGTSLFVAAVGAVANGYWVYAFSGCSYTLGLLFQTLAVHYAITGREPSRDLRNAIVAGGCGGLAACAWATNVMAAPAMCLALVAGSALRTVRPLHHLRALCAFGLGYAATFILPILLAYLLVRAGAAYVGMSGSSAVTFAHWLAAAHHNIPAHFGITQVLRALLGWPESLLSASDLGFRLRLWRFHEAPFPLSPWILGLLVFYVGVLAIVMILVKGRSGFDVRTRWLVYASAFAIVVNLTFGAAWQGTDLERYLPSWPFQMILLAITLNLVWKLGRRAWLIALAPATLAVLVIVNWLGTFEPLLGTDSYRNAWVRAISEHASREDLVIVFGQRKLVIVAPHDDNFPKVHNVSNEIVQRGAGWRSAEIDAIRSTLSRGGRVFLADSLFWPDSAPRDGWSFREYPLPTPADLRQAFLPFKSDIVAFTVGRERVWAARAPAGSPAQSAARAGWAPERNTNMRAPTKLISSPPAEPTANAASTPSTVCGTTNRMSA